MEKEHTVRYPVVAGLFYPDGKDELRQNVEGYLSKVDRSALLAEVRNQTGISDPESQVPLAVVAPHAGFIYSGGVQAYAYALLKGFDIETAVIVGPAHQTPFEGISVNMDDAYRTPLGDVQVDQEAAEKLLEHNGDVQRHEDAHLNEHAVEVQLPFVQTIFPKARILPILLGRQDLETARKLADVIGWVRGQVSSRLVMIASTDLSHYHSHVDASAMDHVLIDDIRNMDPESFNEHIQTGKSEACGFAGLLAAVMYALDHGQGKSAVLRYSDSGEISGNRRNVVGYLSAALY